MPLLATLALTALVALPAPPVLPARLAEGRPVERVLGGGERQELRIAAEAGWYVRIEIEQVGVDVVASLVAPDGATLFSTDDPDGLQDKEVLAVITPAAGDLLLVITAHDPHAAPGPFRAALTAWRPAGPGDAERAAAQKMTAEAWRRLGARDEQGRRDALLLLPEAARLWSSAGEIREQIDALNETGTLQLALSRATAALETFRTVLPLAVQTGDLASQALVHNNLAVASLALGDYPQALVQYRQSLALWKELGDVRGQGRVLYGIGLVYRDQEGNLDAALRSLSEALPLRRAGGDLPGAVNTLIALAMVHQGRGEAALAWESLDQALELGRPAGGAGEGSVLSARAQLHFYRGELGEALDNLRKARELYHRLGNASLEARSLHQLGTLYRELGDLEGAESAYRQGLELVTGNSSEGEVRFLNSLGWNRFLRGDPQAALADFARALALARESDLPAGIARALGQTGAVYVALGRAREGLVLLEEELALHRKNGDRRGEARSLLEIGGARQALGEPEPAEASLRAALDLGRRVGDTGLQAACLFHQAVLARRRGDLRQALSRVEEALRIIESVRSRVSSEKLRTTYLASKRAWYELAVELQMDLEDREPGQGRAAAALEASERARARGLLDLIAEGRINVQEGIAPALKRRETELGARLSWIQERLAEVLAEDPESPRAAGLHAQLDQAGEEMERLEEEVRRRHPRYAEVRYPTPLRLGDVASLLDGRTALLEYFVGHDASFLFVVTRDGLSTHRLPPADVLARQVQDLRRTLERPGILSLGQFRQAAGSLHAALLAPAAAQLARTQNLLISPDGPLSLLPFEALLADPARGASYQDLDYALRGHAISYVPSASVLGSLRQPAAAPAHGAPARKELLAFGDPLDPSLPARAAVALPGSGREVDAIARLYPAADVALYLRDQATEENVKGNPLVHAARRIHFATHGFVDEVRPQLSGLALTRDPGSPEDGLLQVYEIFNLRLDADLVVLSACETALGEQVTGEGLVGLTRSFLYAGARSLLVSLWPVSDLSTPDLMTAFYRHLGDREATRAEALQRAKLDRIARGDEPYRWAPFILAGATH